MFDLANVREGVATTRFAHLHYAAETSSTNDDAAGRLGTPGSAGETFIAEFQRAGRGQRGRRWFAPAGSALLFTTILPEPLATQALWAVPFWCALCVAEGIEAAHRIEVTLQWPNDALLEGLKCGGMLGISRVDGERAYVGCGVGLNVVRPGHDDDLAALDPPPAFLSDATATPSREAILAAILLTFERRLAEFADPDGIARAWERRAALAGTAYLLDLGIGSPPLAGIARRLDRDGALIVYDGTGERSIAVADARVVRK